MPNKFGYLPVISKQSLNCFLFNINISQKFCLSRIYLVYLRTNLIFFYIYTALLYRFINLFSMKKLFIVFAFVNIGSSANSQVLISLLLGDKLNSPNLEFGLEGGLNYTSIGGFESNSLSTNFNLGFYFDIRMKDQWFFYSGVQVVSSFGVDKLTDNDRIMMEGDEYIYDGNYEQKVNAFYVPLLINYKFKNHFYVEAGPQLGLLYDSWVEYTSDEDNKDSVIKDYNDDHLNWFSAGFAGGLGYKLRKGEGMMIGVRYYRDFTDVFDNVPKSKHGSFHLKVNIPIGAGKAKEKEEAENKE